MNKTIILGAGLAGLSTALALAPHPSVVVSPRPLGQGCSSAWAQGGIAAAVGDDDSAALHAADTLAAGAGLNDAAIVQEVTRRGAGVINRLAGLGVPFERDEAGNFRLGLEAAHQKRRIIHAHDATGLAIMKVMIKAVRAEPSIEIIENGTAEELIARDNHVVGMALRCGSEQRIRPTGRVVLASGGAAALWRDTTNPHENWGSGLALAARAGATLGDLEFMQFHPTAIDCGRDPMPLASEALRGEGAILVDENGTRFTNELQARDVLTRALWKHIREGHRVFLDARDIKNIAERFPTVHALCLESGLDPAHAPIPVRPAAHYHMGGLTTDAHGRTSILGLWACGEVACTGLHGANRLASNSLLEAAGFGWRVAEDIKNSDGAFSENKSSESLTEIRSHSYQKDLRTAFAEAATIRKLMSFEVGVIRDHEGLTEAVDYLSPLAAHSDMALVGLMIATSALKRTESRGSHFRKDYPETNVHAQRSAFTMSDLKEIL